MKKTTYEEAMEWVNPDDENWKDLTKVSGYCNEGWCTREQLNQMLLNGLEVFKGRDNIPVVRLYDGDAQLLITESDFDDVDISYGLIDLKDPRVNGGKPYIGYMHHGLYLRFKPDFDFKTDLPLSAYVK